VSYLLQGILNGLANGMNYALIAVGLTVIFGVMRVVNFAHGEFYMLGGLIVFWLAGTLGLNYLLALLLTVLVVALFAAVVDQLLLRPLRTAPELSTVLANIGLSVFLSTAALVVWGPVPQQVPHAFPDAALVLWGDARISPMALFAGLVTAVVIVGMHLLIQRTSLGRQLRATVQDRDAAALVGIDINRVYIGTFAAGSALASFSGALLGTVFLAYPAMGEAAVPKAFVVVVLGGMGSFGGAVVGGMLLGLCEVAGAAWLPGGYKDMVGFVLIVLVLLLRPQGLFGTKVLGR
jgi:branched-chain amino acid transport system permease protein